MFRTIVTMSANSIWIIGTVFIGAGLSVYFSPRSFKRRLLMGLLKRLETSGPAQPLEYCEQILPHSSLQQLYDNLWVVEGTLPPKGPTLPRTMVIYRLPGTRKLVAHSVICVRDDVADEIEALGDVTFIIVPNSFHRLNGLAWAKRYPKAQVITPTFAKAEVERQFGVDATCEEVMGEFGSDEQFTKLPGVAFMRLAKERFELVYLMKLEGVHSDSVALVCCDSLFNLDPAKTDWITRLMGSSAGFGFTKIGVLMSSDVAALHDWLIVLRRKAEAAEIPIEAILVAHGDPVLGKDRVLTHLQIAIDRLKEAL